MTEDSADIFECSVTSEDIFVHNPDWKRRRTATWHMPVQRKGWQSTSGGERVKTRASSRYRWHGAGLASNAQEDAVGVGAIWEVVRTSEHMTESGVMKPGCVQSMQVTALKYVFTSSLHSWQNTEQDVSNNWQRPVHFIRQWEERAALFFTQQCKTTWLPANKWAILNNS